MNAPSIAYFDHFIVVIQPIHVVSIRFGNQRQGLYLNVIYLQTDTKVFKFRSPLHQDYEVAGARLASVFRLPTTNGLLRTDPSLLTVTPHAMSPDVNA
jgi:hypothetical protein